MITYSALEADSPSLVMIMSIANAGITGLLKTQFEQRMTDDVLIIPRIQDLLRDQMIYEQEGKYKLTSKGLLFARIFIVYRHILNISQKGG
jgi:predicted transcriptional regulator